MSSSPAIEEPQSSKKRKEKEDKKDKKDRADKTEKRQKKEKKHRRHEDDDQELERSTKKRKSSDPDQPSKKRKHSHTGPRISPSEQPITASSARSKTNKLKSAATTQLSTSNTSSKTTPFVQQRSSLYLPLSPIAHAYPIQGLCAEHLSPLLLTYYPPLHGVILAFSDPHLTESPSDDPTTNGPSSPEQNDTEGKTVLAQSLNEYATPYIWLTATFTLFRPRRGTFLEGTVNLQNESLLGLVCYNFFNAVIEREDLPDEWKWVDAEVEDEGEIGRGGGYYVDGEGKKVQGKMEFRVQDFEIVGGIEGAGASVSIIGTLKKG